MSIIMTVQCYGVVSSIEKISGVTLTVAHDQLSSLLQDSQSLVISPKVDQQSLLCLRLNNNKDDR